MEMEYICSCGIKNIGPFVALVDDKNQRINEERKKYLDELEEKFKSDQIAYEKKLSELKKKATITEGELKQLLIFKDGSIQKIKSVEFEVVETIEPPKMTTASFLPTLYIECICKRRKYLS